jgi:hypothetical protein
VEREALQEVLECNKSNAGGENARSERGKGTEVEAERRSPREAERHLAAGVVGVDAHGSEAEVMTRSSGSLERDGKDGTENGKEEGQP